jgi:hypothetical protein
MRLSEREFSNGSEAGSPLFTVLSVIFLFWKENKVWAFISSCLHDGYLLKTSNHIADLIILSLATNDFHVDKLLPDSELCGKWETFWSPGGSLSTCRNDKRVYSINVSFNAWTLCWLLFCVFQWLNLFQYLFPGLIFFISIYSLHLHVFL